MLVHGLTGSMNEALHVNAACALQAAGIASLRINLYDDAPGARRLLECTVSTHAADVDTVVRRLRKDDVGRRATVIVGHSLGGLTALLMRESVDGIALWDSTHTDTPVFDTLQLSKALGVYIWPRRVSTLLGQPMIEEIRSLDTEALLAAVGVPVLVVGAAEEAGDVLARRHYAAAHEPKELAVIPGSDHTFSLGDTADELYERTIQWIQQIASVPEHPTDISVSR